MFLSSNNNKLSTSIKISGIIKNLKISANSAFSFSAIESIRKRGISRISKKVDFKRRRSDQSHFCCKESIVNSFNYKLHAKIWGERDFLKYQGWFIPDSWKLSCFDRKTSKWYPFYVSKISILSDLSAWQKSPELLVNLKISPDSAFSF